MVVITHEQKINCSKAHLGAVMHEQAIIGRLPVICRSRGGLSVNEKEEKIH